MVQSLGWSLYPGDTGGKGTLFISHWSQNHIKAFSAMKSSVLSHAQSRAVNVQLASCVQIQSLSFSDNTAFLSTALLVSPRSARVRDPHQRISSLDNSPDKSYSLLLRFASSNPLLLQGGSSIVSLSQKLLNLSHLGLFLP